MAPSPMQQMQLLLLPCMGAVAALRLMPTSPAAMTVQHNQQCRAFSRKTDSLSGHGAFLRVHDWVTWRSITTCQASQPRTPRSRAVPLMSAPETASAAVQTEPQHIQVASHAETSASASAQVVDQAEQPAEASAPKKCHEPVELHFSEAGARSLTKAPPIVILHGLFGAGGNFKTWASGLASQLDADKTPRRIMLVDLRNHGSSAHSSEMSFDAMAADVLALLDKQGIKQAVLCGHSLGGKVAMALALARPERIERLIVLDIAPVSYDTHDGSCWNEIHQVVRAMRSIDLERVRSKTDADAVLARTISDPGLRAFVLTNMLRDQNGRFRWRINLPVISQKLDELAGWEAPAAEPYGGNALFVSGGKSQYVRSLHLPAISELFRRFSVTTLRGAAHWVHADEPESLRLIVLKFLQAPSA